MTLNQADREAILSWRDWFNEKCNTFYAERCATTFLEYARFGPLPIRLKSLGKQKPLLADNLTLTP